MIIDFTPAIPYLDALHAAENFTSIFEYAQRYDEPYAIDEAMEMIERWCPHLWPIIDRQVLLMVSNEST